MCSFRFVSTLLNLQSSSPFFALVGGNCLAPKYGPLFNALQRENFIHLDALVHYKYLPLNKSITYSYSYGRETS